MRTLNLRVVAVLLGLQLLIFPQLVAQNTLQWVGGQGTPLQTVRCSLVLNNTQAVQGGQMDIVFPSSVAEWVSGSDSLVWLRKDDHLLATSLVSPGRLRILFYSPSGAGLKGNSGAVVYLNFRLRNTGGAFPVSLEGAVLSGMDNNPLTATVQNGTIGVLAPRIEVDTSLSFSYLNLAQQEERAVTIYNRGLVPLQIGRYQLPSDEFALQHSSFPVSIPAGGSQSFPVRYQPLRRGNKAVALKWYSNDLTLPDSVSTTRLKAEAYALNVLGLQGVSGNSGDTLTLPVVIDNQERFTAWQVDIQLPNGVAYIPGSAALGSERRDDHLLQAQQNGNVLRLISYSPSQLPFKGTSGSVATVRIRPVLPQGYYYLGTSNVLLTDSSSQNLIYYSQGGSLTINSPRAGLQPADILSYGYVVTGDTAFRNLLITNNGSAALSIHRIEFADPAFFTRQAFPVQVAAGGSVSVPIGFTPGQQGNYNATGTVFTNDPTGLKTVQLKGTGRKANLLVVEDLSVTFCDTAWLKINLVNDAQVNGFQFDLYRSDTSFRVLGSLARLNPNRSSDHALAKQYNPTTQSWRFLSYSMGNSAFSGGNGAVLEIPVVVKPSSAGTTSSQFYIRDSILVGTSGGNVITEAIGGRVTGERVNISYTGATTFCSDKSLLLSGSAQSSLQYQWYKDNTPIPGETARQLTVTGSGQYQLALTSEGCRTQSDALAITVEPAATITMHPVAQSVCAGSNAVFSVSAAGSKLAYQWRRNGAAIEGATDSVLRLSNVAAALAGRYDVEVRGDCENGMLSEAVSLTVNTLPVITTQPANQVVTENGNVTFSISIRTEGAAIQWKKDGQDIAGATAASYTITGAHLTDSGYYQAVVSNDCGSVTSNTVTLSVSTSPVAILQTVDSLVFGLVSTGDSVTQNLVIRNTGTAILTIQQLNFSQASFFSTTILPLHIGGGTSVSVPVVFRPVQVSVFESSLSIVSNNATGIKTIRLKGVGSGQNTLVVEDLTNYCDTAWLRINLSNADSIVGFQFDLYRSDTSFQVLGSLARLNPARSVGHTLAKQFNATTQSWRFLSYNMSMNPFRENAGYIIEVPVVLKSKTSASALFYMKDSSLVTAAGANVIKGAADGRLTMGKLSINYTGSTTFCPGDSLVLTGSVLTEGRYQWYSNNAAIAGATTQSYVARDASYYQVGIQSAACTLRSDSLQVQVLPRAAIVSQPAAQDKCAGAAVSFTVAATGHDLSYQWRKDGVAIAGATSATFSLSSAALADSGDYRVVVFSACDSVASSTVRLTVRPLPTKPVITAVGNTLSASSAGGNQWYLNGLAISGATGQQYSAQASGLYTVQTTQNGCSTLSDGFNFIATGIVDPTSWNNEVMAFPNPVNGNLFIRNTNARRLQVQLLDVVGRVVYEGVFSATTRTINMQRFTGGTYLLLITDTRKNETISKTIVKQ